MSNSLRMPKKVQVLALLELGWSYRSIETETACAAKRLAAGLYAIAITETGLEGGPPRLLARRRSQH